jgi:hypothetical protein
MLFELTVALPDALRPIPMPQLVMVLSFMVAVQFVTVIPTKLLAM